MVKKPLHFDAESNARSRGELVVSTAATPSLSSELSTTAVLTVDAVKENTEQQHTARPFSSVHG